MTPDFAAITHNLEFKNGIWYSKLASNISYPEEGNDLYYQIETYSFWFRHRNNCIIETVKNFTPNALFFDVGGGNGYVSYGMEKAGIKTVLVEPGQKGVLNAKERGLKKIICSTLEEMELSDATLDAIGVFDVVEHTQDDVAFLSMLNKYLKPGGMLYITVPAFNFLWSHEDILAGHFRRYTLKSMEKILKKSGFVTQFSTYFFSILPIPVFLFRSLPFKIGMHKNHVDLNKNMNSHLAGRGIFNWILEKIWKWELRKISKIEKIPFGGSCLFVAEKI